MSQLQETEAQKKVSFAKNPGNLYSAGNIKGVSQLCVLSTLGFLHLIPKCFPVAKPLWRVRWEQNFAVQYTVL